MTGQQKIILLDQLWLKINAHDSGMINDQLTQLIRS